MEEIDTMNRFMVGVRGDKIAFALMPVPREISTDDALNLAAWLVALADPTGDKFPAILEAVRNT